MSWFERHLNWSLFFAISLLPFVVSLIVVAIFFAFMGPTIVAMFEGGEPTMESIFSTMLPLFIVGLILSLAYLVWEIIALIWYLRKKARSKWFLMLVFGPAIVQVILGLLGAKDAGEVIGGLSALVCIIILYCLKNLSTGDYGGDFAGESVTGGWPGTLPPSVLDDRQLKELDYTPDKNVLDMVGGSKANDVGGTKSIADVGAVSATGVDGEQVAATEKAPAEEKTEEIKVVERPVSQERLNMPVLMDNAGVAIRCFYHAGADAVNLCSRCKQYVCIECNYVTGTHPICRNCWEKRGEIRLTPPAQKVSPAPHKAEKPKTAEVAEPEKQESQEPGQPEAPVLVESAKPVESLEPVEPMGPIEAGVTEPEQQEIVAPLKPAKQEAEKSEWQQEFMALYQQTLPIINVIISKGADNMPASPLDLMEGLKLRPMLERAKKLSKPRDKELRGARSEFEQVLSSCIKIADSAANFVSGGGQALLGGPDFKRIVSGIETANELMEKLSQKVDTFSRPQE